MLSFKFHPNNLHRSGGGEEGTRIFGGGSYRPCRRRRGVSVAVCSGAKPLVMDHVVDDVIETRSPVGGGVQDPYGEDRATEEQFVTPWSVTVARCNGLQPMAEHRTGPARCRRRRAELDFGSCPGLPAKPFRPNLN